MKKLKKIDYLYIGIIFSTIIVYLLLFTNFFKYTYGSRVDWDVQHWLIPDYLRTLFYNNKNIFTNLAINLGGGQNIFYNTYYGFLSPIILFSYLLPFVPMYIYIQIISILLLLISSVFFYKFILNKSNSKIAFISTLMLFSMTPILYHSHRHIMFVIYYPFLIMGLFGVDKFINHKKSLLLIVSSFLLIMTNYFFSVPSLICLYIYGISQILTTKKKKNNGIIKNLFKLAIPFIIAILLGAVIILPTFYTLIFGRSPSNSNINFYSLFLPNLSFSKSLYSTYSIGLNYILLFSLMYFILHRINKEYTALSLIIITLLLFPIFSYIINATMYVDYKIFIPFCPLAVYIFSKFCIMVSEKKINKKYIIMSLIIVLVIALSNYIKTNNMLIILEICFIITQVLLLKNKKINVSFITMAIVLTIFIPYSSLYKEKKYEISKYKLVEQDNAFLFDNYTSKDNNSIYRVAFLNSALQNSNYIYNKDVLKISNYSSVSNNYYKNFYSNYSGNEISQRSFGKIVDTVNPFFNVFMGVRYIYSDSESLPGYDKVDNNVFINTNAFPIFYSSTKIMSSKEFESLEFPYNMEAYLKYIIVDEELKENVFKSSIVELNPIILKDNVEIDNNKKHILIIDKEEKYEYTIDNWNNDKDLLIISFDLEANKCPRDLKITINGVTNILSCEQWKYYNKNNNFKYVITGKENKIEISIGPGNYAIDNIRYYTISKNELNNNEIDRPNKVEIYEDRIEVELSVKNDDSYAILTVPYDKGFSFYIDGKYVEHQIVNKSFSGIRIEKGEHKITIKYQSPFFKEGLIITSSTILLCAILFLKKRTIKK